ncbi:uncharacterized protein BDCG_17429 [Blastomyces dermatitidis ER-3]|uniref:Uncharacterized protein n=1 Tax=Ajellomyces dermatitidis (strain ER-3 / ATCC MYA-2586) TaxID=559297 RepID=A0ABX2VYH8_AJEDR|nr:uncharacterized protein BDCG_17429 [Blastomyces dermatitidis ER-3]OAT02187.1 hypothetical protein BDCG_17429 [Blastomyces dermatitidis ER-3]
MTAATRGRVGKEVGILLDQNGQEGEAVGCDSREHYIVHYLIERGARKAGVHANVVETLPNLCFQFPLAMSGNLRIFQLPLNIMSRRVVQ